MKRALALVAVGACAHGGGLACPDHVPAAIAPGADVSLAFVLHGRGVQRYACSGGAWTLVAPAAELDDDGGARVGRHGAGPAWELDDGSRVVGAKLAAAPVDPSAVPWLLVGVASHDGAGRLADVTRIQRLHTTGGVAPAGACVDRATADVPYTADYYFYRPARGSGELRCGI